MSRVRHSPAPRDHRTTPPLAIVVPTAVQNSHKDNVRSSAVGKQLKQKKSNSAPTQHHRLPALELFSLSGPASFIERVHLRPGGSSPAALDHISPGLTLSVIMISKHGA